MLIISQIKSLAKGEQSGGTTDPSATVCLVRVPVTGKRAPGLLSCNGSYFQLFSGGKAPVGVCVFPSWSDGAQGVHQCFGSLPKGVSKYSSLSEMDSFMFLISLQGYFFSTNKSLSESMHIYILNFIFGKIKLLRLLLNSSWSNILMPIWQSAALLCSLPQNKLCVKPTLLKQNSSAVSVV